MYYSTQVRNEKHAAKWKLAIRNFKYVLPYHILVCIQNITIIISVLTSLPSWHFSFEQ
jgi:hypothetical protein